MKTDLKLLVLIEVLKIQLGRLESKEGFVYQTLEAVIELAESIKNQD